MRRNIFLFSICMKENIFATYHARIRDKNIFLNVAKSKPCVFFKDMKGEKSIVILEKLKSTRYCFA